MYYSVMKDVLCSDLSVSIFSLFLSVRKKYFEYCNDITQALITFHVSSTEEMSTLYKQTNLTCNFITTNRLLSFATAVSMLVVLCTLRDPFQILS